jgi:hypothetical protein
MKPTNLILLSAAITSAALGGDWGKTSVDQTPIEERVDLGGVIEAGYHSDYLYKGYRFGRDSVSGSVDYNYEGLALPLTVGVDHVNVISGNRLTNIVNGDLSLSLAAGLPSVAGIDASLSYVHHFYTEDPNTALWPSSNGEIGLHLAKDLSLAVLKFDLFHNLDLPNAWNGTLPAAPNSDSGAWFWNLGLERSLEILGQQLVLGGGVAYADNYWGAAPNLQNGGRSSGWNHYYLRASLPVELNCRTVITPYLGYTGAPDSWLLDGAPYWGGFSGQWGGFSGQSDILHGGVTVSVSF